MAGTARWIVTVAAAALLVTATYSSGIRAQSTAAPAAANPTEQQIEQMQARMNTMQQQMSALQSTKDPAARQKLLDAHMRTMQEQMQAMRSLGGGMMTGQRGAMGSMHGRADMGSMHGGNAMGMGMQRGAASADDQPDSRQPNSQMMMHRMDMMQMMMEQMMGQMAAMTGHGMGEGDFRTGDGRQ